MKTLIKVSLLIGCLLLLYISLTLSSKIVNAIVPGTGRIYALDIVLTVLFCLFLPSLLFKKLNAFWAKKDVEAFEISANSHGLTPGEYASTVFPPSLLDVLEDNAAYDDEFEKILKQSIDAAVITTNDANVLRYMFRVQKKK